MKSTFIIGTFAAFLISFTGFSQRDIDPEDTLTNRLRLKELNQEIALGKANYETWYNCGLLKAALNDTAGALKDYDLSISMNTTFAPSFINRGVLYHKQRKFKLAEKDFTTAIDLDEESAVAINNRGYLYLEMELYDKAIRDFEGSIKRDKTHTLAYMNKVTIYTMRADIENAIATCDDMALALPNDPKVYTTRSDVYSDFGDVANALKDQNKAVEVSGNDPSYIIERSRFKDDHNDDIGAVEDCDLAISLAPNVGYYHYMRSRPLYDLQEYTGVLESCERAIELDPTEHRAMVMKANVLDAYGMQKEAIVLYEQAITIAPNDADAYDQLAFLHYNMGDIPLARLTLLRNEGGGNNYRRTLALGQLASDMGDYELALADFTKLTKIDPNSGEAYYLCGLIKDTLQDGASACQLMLIADSLGSAEAHYYLRKKCRASMDVKLMKVEDLEEEAYGLEMKGDFKSAIKLYSDAISITPEESRLYYNRGKAKRRMEDHVGAIADYQKAIDLKPVVDYWVSMGVSYNYLDMINEAKRAYEQAIKLEPSYAMSYYNLGIIYAQKKNFEKAIGLFLQSLNYAPDYTKALVALGESYMTIGDNASACVSFRKAEALGDNSVFGKRVRACTED